MTGYLQRLAASTSGEAASLKPRLPSLFEPNAFAEANASLGDFVVAPMEPSSPLDSPWVRPEPLRSQESTSAATTKSEQPASIEPHRPRVDEPAGSAAARAESAQLTSDQDANTVREPSGREGEDLRDPAPRPESELRKLRVPDPDGTPDHPIEAQSTVKLPLGQAVRPPVPLVLPADGRPPASIQSRPRRPVAGEITSVEATRRGEQTARTDSPAPSSAQPTGSGNLADTSAVSDELQSVAQKNAMADQTGWPPRSATVAQVGQSDTHSLDADRSPPVAASIHTPLQPLLPALPLETTKPAAPAQQPVVHVTIGRIEIKATTSDRRPARKQGPPAAAVESLAEYLQKHAMGGGA